MSSPKQLLPIFKCGAVAAILTLAVSGSVALAADPPAADAAKEKTKESAESVKHDAAAEEKTKEAAEAVKHDAVVVGEAVKDGAQKVAGAAKEVAVEVADAAKQGAQEVASAAKTGVEKTKAAVGGEKSANKTDAPKSPAP